MRELKFRVFNSKTSCMSNVMDYETSWNDGELLPIRKMFTFMQYTGLKDKTGKEIYEDDILKLFHPNGIRYFTGKIIFIDGAYYVGNTPLIEFDEFEILGNIHENPELLS